MGGRIRTSKNDPSVEGGGQIDSCLATSQPPESIRSNPVMMAGCSVSSSNWFVTSIPTPRQFMPNGWPSAPIDEYHLTHLLLKPAGGCSVITP